MLQVCSRVTLQKMCHPAMFDVWMFHICRSCATLAWQDSANTTRDDWAKLGARRANVCAREGSAAAPDNDALPSRTLVASLALRKRQDACICRLARMAASGTLAAEVARESIIAAPSWDMVESLQSAVRVCRGAGEEGAAQWAAQMSAWVAAHMTALLMKRTPAAAALAKGESQPQFASVEGMLIIGAAAVTAGRPWEEPFLDAIQDTVALLLEHAQILRSELERQGLTCSVPVADAGLPAAPTASAPSAATGTGAAAAPAAPGPLPVQYTAVSPFTRKLCEALAPGTGWKGRFVPLRHRTAALQVLAGMLHGPNAAGGTQADGESRSSDESDVWDDDCDGSLCAPLLPRMPSADEFHTIDSCVMHTQLRQRGIMPLPACVLHACLAGMAGIPGVVPVGAPNRVMVGLHGPTAVRQLLSAGASLQHPEVQAYLQPPPASADLSEEASAALEWDPTGDGSDIQCTSYIDVFQFCVPRTRSALLFSIRLPATLPPAVTEWLAPLGAAGAVERMCNNIESCWQHTVGDDGHAVLGIAAEFNHMQPLITAAGASGDAASSTDDSSSAGITEHLARIKSDMACTQFAGSIWAPLFAASGEQEVTAALAQLGLAHSPLKLQPAHLNPAQGKLYASIYYGVSFSTLERHKAWEASLPDGSLQRGAPPMPPPLNQVFLSRWGSYAAQPSRQVSTTRIGALRSKSLLLAMAHAGVAVGTEQVFALCSVKQRTDAAAPPSAPPSSLPRTGDASALAHVMSLGIQHCIQRCSDSGAQHKAAAAPAPPAATGVGSSSPPPPPVGAALGGDSAPSTEVRTVLAALAGGRRAYAHRLQAALAHVPALAAHLGITPPSAEGGSQAADGAEGDSDGDSALPDAPGGSAHDGMLYSPCMVMMHRRHGYVGVIVDADPVCTATADWQHHMGVTPAVAAKPFYSVKVDGRFFQGAEASTYVAECNVQLLTPMPLVQDVIACVGPMHDGAIRQHMTRVIQQAVDVACAAAASTGVPAKVLFGQLHSAFRASVHAGLAMQLSFGGLLSSGPPSGLRWLAGALEDAIATSTPGAFISVDTHASWRKQLLEVQSLGEASRSQRVLQHLMRSTTDNSAWQHSELHLTMLLGHPLVPRWGGFPLQDGKGGYMGPPSAASMLFLPRPSAVWDKPQAAARLVVWGALLLTLSGEANEASA